MTQPTGQPMGPPRGNLNGLKSGRKMGRRTFVLSSLGAKFGSVRKHLERTRDRLESAYVAAHGVVTPEAEADLSEVLRAELLALLAYRAIRDDQGDAVERAKVACQATAQRNAAIRRLKLTATRADGESGDEWAAMRAKLVTEGRQDLGVEGIDGNAIADAVGDQDGCSAVPSRIDAPTLPGPQTVAGGVVSGRGDHLS